VAGLTGNECLSSYPGFGCVIALKKGSGLGSGVRDAKGSGLWGECLLLRYALAMVYVYLSGTFRSA
jgi:hypothetical protein